MKKKKLKKTVKRFQASLRETFGKIEELLNQTRGVTDPNVLRRALDNFEAALGSKLTVKEWRATDEAILAAGRERLASWHPNFGKTAP